MSDEQLGSLRVDRARLMEELHHTCQWGEGKRWGRYVDVLSFMSCLGGLISDEKSQEGMGWVSLVMRGGIHDIDCIFQSGLSLQRHH